MRLGAGAHVNEIHGKTIRKNRVWIIFGEQMIDFSFRLRLSFFKFVE